MTWSWASYFAGVATPFVAFFAAVGVAWWREWRRGP